MVIFPLNKANWLKCKNYFILQNSQFWFFGTLSAGSEPKLKPCSDWSSFIKARVSAWLDGCTSFYAVWLFLGPLGIGRYATVATTSAEEEEGAGIQQLTAKVVDLSDWKSAVALVSLHQFAGMAISFGLQIDARSLTAAFVVTIVPLWCYIRK